MNTRRHFLQQMALAGGLGLTLPLTAMSKDADNLSSKSYRPLKFGIIADIHRDLIPDADQRLENFMRQVEKEKPEFIISLGDFCFGKPENRSFVQTFANAPCPAYHVLGNHDMDYNNKEEMIAFLGIPSRYYSFESGSYHFVVLDANNLYHDGQFTGYSHGNFYVNNSLREYIDDEQIAWFKNDIASSRLPVIVFSHQSLYHYSLGVKNRLELQLIMEDENRKAGYSKVIACFNGHNHLDFYREINRIHYFDINSASYEWIEPAIPGRYDKNLYEKYRHLDNIALYKDSLFAFVNIDTKGTLTLQGVQSEWNPPAPILPEKRLGNKNTPCISNQKVHI